MTIDIQISNIINSRLMFDRSLFSNGSSEAFLVDYIFCLSITIKVWKANALMSFLVLILAFIKGLFVTHFFCTRDTWKFYVFCWIVFRMKFILLFCPVLQVKKELPLVKETCTLFFIQRPWSFVSAYWWFTTNKLI